jgi:CheY-like chemotaxis protein
MSIVNNDISYENEHVLVVDDEDIVREPISAMLRTWVSKLIPLRAVMKRLKNSKQNPIVFC